MKRLLASLLLISGLSGGQAFAGDLEFGKDFWAAPTAGTLGPGVEAGWRYNDYWGARVGANAFAFGFVYSRQNYDLHDRASSLSAGITADYYPFAGDFRLSGGARIAANKIEGRMRNLHKGMKFVPNPETTFTLEQNTIQPYLGAGYTVKLKDRVSLNFDLGALYTGTPQLSVDSHAERYGFTRREIRNEIERARDRVAPFKVYPVVQIGLKFQF